jgi:hypothetical protein
LAVIITQQTLIVVNEPSKYFPKPIERFAVKVDSEYILVVYIDDYFIKKTNKKTLADKTSRTFDIRIFFGSYDYLLHIAEVWQKNSYEILFILIWLNKEWRQLKYLPDQPAAVKQSG